MPSRPFRRLLVSIAIGSVTLAAGYPVAAAPSSPVIVVAAENFYGDIVGQIGGDHVAVTSIVSDPNIDPHEYETNARDAAAVANARLIIQNGLGYDAFMDRLEAASPNSQRKLIVVSELTGHKKGDNVHLWYDPATIPKVAQVVLEALVQIDSANAPSYRNWYRAFQASLPPLTQAIADLRAQHAGTAVGATEPVFGYMAQAIGLNVITPVKFQKAIEEGEDPPAAALAQMEDQVRKHQVRLLLYNIQTVSPITKRVQELAKRQGVPVVGVSETEPPGKTFQQWMLTQLEQVRAALAQGK
ncbi:MAG TPA: zinc ABC transporter substrate-binding protein [bacterium]|nr:zinc ABC transporter substrate-binding protein [bacterium]